jgi:hypothetical protein
MMHGPEKSDPAIVAMKPTNEAGRSAEEPVERRAGTKGTRTRATPAGHRAGSGCRATRALPYFDSKLRARLSDGQSGNCGDSEDRRACHGPC